MTVVAVGGVCELDTARVVVGDLVVGGVDGYGEVGGHGRPAGAGWGRIYGDRGCSMGVGPRKEIYEVVLANLYRRGRAN